MFLASRHTLGAYDDALRQLRDDVLTMASFAEGNLSLALSGLFKRDSEACKEVQIRDEQVDNFEKRIDQAGIEIIVRYRPVASDLRSVVGAMKLGSHLERVGDLAVSVARKAARLNEQARLPELHLVEPLAFEVGSLLKDALRAFSEHNSEEAMTIRPRDKQIDELKRQTCNRLMERMTQEPASIEQFLDLIFVARHLERVGDYAKSIAENTVFMEIAYDIRHRRKTTGEPG